MRTMHRIILKKKFDSFNHHKNILSISQCSKQYTLSQKNPKRKYISSSTRERDGYGRLKFFVDCDPAQITSLTGLYPSGKKLDRGGCKAPQKKKAQVGEMWRN